MIRNLVIALLLAAGCTCFAQSKNPELRPRISQKAYQNRSTIKAGSLVMELHPWYGSAGLVEAFRLHKKVEKTSAAD